MSRGRIPKNWKFNFFLSLSYLQLIFPAPRTELRGKRWGLPSFQCMCPVEPRGKVKTFSKVNTLVLVFGHWVIDWKFVFELWVGKKVARCQNCIQYVQKNNLRWVFFCKKKLQSFITLNFRQKISVCWQ